MEAKDDTVEFNCSCGMKILARLDQGGRAFRCSACGASVRIPRVAVKNRAVDLNEGALSTGTERKVFVGRFKVPASFSELLGYLLLGWASASVLLFVLSFFSIYLKFLALIAFLAATVTTAQQIWFLLRARQLVLERKDVSLLWGLVRLIAWDPVEGVLFLQNKRLGFKDDDLHDGHGGVRFIYPVLGEELALRVPLEVQTLHFSDKKVLTREYLAVNIRGSVKWRITNIEKFYLLVSRVLRSSRENDAGDARLSPSPKNADIDAEQETTIGKLIAAAIEWLRLLAEEQTRLVMSHVSSGLLIADRLSHEVPEIKAATSSTSTSDLQTGSEWRNAADGLGGKIFQAVSAGVSNYGISIDDVSLQEIQLPEEIVQQCISACKAAYLPLLAEREAAARHAQLAGDVALLGKDAVATERIVGAAPSFALGDFIAQFLSKQLANPTGNGPLTAAITGGMAAAALPIAGLPK